MYALWMAVALVLTLLFEVPVVVLGFYKERKYYGNVGKLVLNTILINAVTNLGLNLIRYFVGDIWALDGGAYSVILAVLEVFVVITECKMFKIALAESVSKSKRICVVTLANAISFVLGLFVFLYI